MTEYELRNMPDWQLSRLIERIEIELRRREEE